jgi:hypothetical protein
MPSNSLAPSHIECADPVSRDEPVIFDRLEESDEDWPGAMRGVFVYGPALSLGLYGVIAAAVWFLL